MTHTSSSALHRIALPALLFAGVFVGMFVGVACGDSDAATDAGSHGHGSDSGSQTSQDAASEQPGDGGGSSAADGGGSPAADGGGGDDVSENGTGFGAIWKRHSSDLTVIDTTSPSDFKTATVTLPNALPEPIDGHDLDIYQTIKDEKLYTYAFRAGDKVYYRIETMLTKSDDTTYVAVSSDGGDTHVYELQDGAFTELGNISMGTIIVSTNATYTKHTGSFPPRGWPTKMFAVKP